MQPERPHHAHYVTSNLVGNDSPTHTICDDSDCSTHCVTPHHETDLSATYVTTDLGATYDTNSSSSNVFQPRPRLARAS